MRRNPWWRDKNQLYLLLAWGSGGKDYPTDDNLSLHQHLLSLPLPNSPLLSPFAPPFLCSPFPVTKSSGLATHTSFNLGLLFSQTPISWNLPGPDTFYLHNQNCLSTCKNHWSLPDWPGKKFPSDTLKTKNTFPDFMTCRCTRNKSSWDIKSKLFSHKVPSPATQMQQSTHQRCIHWAPHPSLPQESNPVAPMWNVFPFTL